MLPELIDQLRESIENGGWKVEVKSKFHTLSSCADYLKYLIKATKDKEEAVNKAKADLQMKKRKVEEDKALQESRSDPESVMSSLTSSTGGESSSVHQKVSKTEKLSEDDGQRKRKSTSKENSSKANKKSRLSSTQDSFGSSESSGEERVSVSDITDSNKESSNSGSSNQRSDDDDESGTPSSLSASSDAAVVQALDKKHQHADVVIKGRTKPPKEVTSLEESFVLDFEEVFLKSNVPQIIATTAGRIVACKFSYWRTFIACKMCLQVSICYSHYSFCLLDLSFCFFVFRE